MITVVDILSICYAHFYNTVHVTILTMSIELPAKRKAIQCSIKV